MRFMAWSLSFAEWWFPTPILTLTLRRCTALLATGRFRSYGGQIRGIMFSLGVKARGT